MEVTDRSHKSMLPSRIPYLLTACLLLACLGLADCGSGNARDKKSGKADGTGGSLLLWVMPNSPKPEKDMMDLLEPFKATHPGVDIKVSVLDWGSAWTKLTTAAISGDGPDVVQLGTTWTPAKPRASNAVNSLPWFIDVRPMF